MGSEQPVSDSALQESDAAVSSMGPTVLRITLGTQLRALREAAGLTREAAAESIRGSATKISRLELGRVRFRDRDIADLLTLYGKTDPQERAQLLDLARRANCPGWWQQYADLLPPWFETYLGLEQACSVIRTYECQLIPGLLQTREYAHAVTGLAHTDPAEVQRRVELRLRRQRVLTDPQAPVLWAVIDEAALQRPMIGPALHRAQLTHLIEAAEQPNISIQIAPFARGAHAAAGGSFTLLRFAEAGVPDIVYLEQLTSALYLDRRADVEHYAMVMDRLCAQIEPPERTPALLDALRRQS
jgi:transcriptional regulator with XRE-family HTH domain